MLAIRKVVQDYGGSCERLLSNHSFDSPLSQEEVAFIQGTEWVHCCAI